MHRLGALALVLVVPLASAQELEPAFSIDPLSGPVAPLQEVKTTRWSVDLLCEPTLPAGTRALHVWVVGAPAWSIATVSPAELAVPGDCAGSRVLYEGDLVIGTTEKAPAGVAEALTLGYAYESARGNLSGTSSVNVTAGWFGILGLQAGQAIRVASPGEVVEFLIEIENRGNDDGTVTFEVDSRLEVEPIAPVTLQSAQKGGTSTSARVRVRVRAQEGEAYMNAVAVVQVNATLARASDGTIGDVASAAFVLTTRGIDATPVPGAWAALALAGAAMMRARRPA